MCLQYLNSEHAFHAVTWSLELLFFNYFVCLFVFTDLYPHPEDAIPDLLRRSHTATNAAVMKNE